jgi:predicted tellurium resistance membrane protein TerC
VEHLLTVESLIALLTLTALEIVLGIDNIVFITILAGKLEPSLQEKARKIGLALAMIMRIALLLAIGWIMRLTDPLFSILDHPVSTKDLIMIAGGMFLIGKATYEIHDKIEGARQQRIAQQAVSSFGSVIVQILTMDVIFSLDSVITAVGMARYIPIMVAAIVISVGIMMAFTGAVGRFVEAHATLKILALAFLLLIGVMLVAEGCGKHIDKGYIYFAMGFALVVEMINMKIRKGTNNEMAAAATGA